MERKQLIRVLKNLKEKQIIDGLQFKYLDEVNEENRAIKKEVLSFDKERLLY